MRIFLNQFYLGVSAVWLFAAVTAVSAKETADRILFANLGVDDGLTPGEVTALLHDREGLIWIGTENGLNRYDGFSVKAFRREPDDPSQLADDHITALAEDLRGNIWVGTFMGGLHRLDPQSGSFQRIIPENVDVPKQTLDHVTELLPGLGDWVWVGTSRGLFKVTDNGNGTAAWARVESDEAAPPHITALKRAQDGTILVGSGYHGLFQMNPGSMRMVQLWHPRVEISGMVFDSEGFVWLATQGKGIIKLNLKTGWANRIADGRNPDFILPSQDVNALTFDGRGDLWAGTPAGLVKVHLKDERISHYGYQLGVANGLAGGEVQCLLRDRYQVLWSGCSNGGVSRHSLTRHWFPVYRAREGASNGLAHSSIWDMDEGADGRIWMATEGGINRWDSESGEFETFGRETGTPGDEGVEPFACAVLEDRNQAVWVGTKGEGLYRLGKEGALEAVYRPDPQLPGALPCDSVAVLCETADGRLWLAGPNTGVVGYDRETNTFKDHPLPLNGVGGFVHELTPDGGGGLWVSTVGLGLLRFDPVTGQYQTLEDLAERPVPLSSPNVSLALMSHAQPGVLWVGTLGRGLNRVDVTTWAVRQYLPSAEGIPHGDIFSLMEDAEGNLWAGTGRGLACYDPRAETFRLFGVKDGLQADAFHPHAYARTPSGKLVFGGPDGFNVIDPAHLPAAPRPPNPVLTGLDWYGERVVPSKEGLLRQPLSRTQEVRIPYDRRGRLAFRFTSADFGSLTLPKFRFRLEGLEEDWTLAEGELRASYTALDPGKYEFVVQASRDGVNWNSNGARVALVVTPPWYATWWSRGLLVAALIGVAVGYAALRVRIHSAVRRRREEQLESERTRAEAALARQMQHAMLLEQTTAEFQQSLIGSQVFQTAATHLGTHLAVDRCLIRIADEITDEGDGLPVVAEFLSGAVDAAGHLPINDDWRKLFAQVLRSEHALTYDDVRHAPDLVMLREALQEMGVLSMMAVRTTYMDQPNGMILLHRSVQRRRWEDDEVRLVETLAAQVGIAIAQYQLHQKEETQRRELDRARKAAEVANQAKSEFLAKMTHELRTPLNAIIGFSQIISEDESVDPKVRETIGIINSSGEHLLEVINEVLDMSKIEAGQAELSPTQFDLLQMLKSVYDMLAFKARAKGLRFDFTKEGDLPPVIIADKNKLRQVLINLIGNSTKFTDEGRIRLKVWCENHAPTPLAVDSTGDHYGSDEAPYPIELHFEVMDTGRGISEEELPRLFEKFRQTESGKGEQNSTGLGLSITRSFIELMGGKIEVRSELGKGTVFHLTVACEAVPQHETNAVAGDCPADNVSQSGIVAKGRAGDATSPYRADNERPYEDDGSTDYTRVRGLEPGHDELRILVADDKPMNRLLVRKMLGPIGFTIDEAENGQMAIDRWREWHPHLILMDEEMPEKRGSEATLEISQEAAEEKPVIISLTAFAMDADRQHMLEAGCDDFLGKPFKREELLAVIEKFLGVRYSYQTHPREEGQTAAA